MKNKILNYMYIGLCLNFGFVSGAYADNECQSDPASQKCAMTHPHFFFDGADLKFDTKLGYIKNVSDNGALGLEAVGSGSFKGSLNFTNWSPSNKSTPKNWVENDILQTLYATYTNPVSWGGDHMQNTNGGGSTPSDLRYAVNISALKVHDQASNQNYTCRNVVIARGEDNWWVFQNDGKRPKNGPGLYCYRDANSPTNIQPYDIYLLGGVSQMIDGEEVYKMKVKIEGDTGE